jgi:hypothetical protein
MTSSLRVRNGLRYAKCRRDCSQRHRQHVFSPGAAREKDVNELGSDV